MSLYSRLDRRLEAQADNAGQVRGTLSLTRIGMIWLAANLVVTTLLTGTLLIPAVGFATAVAMIVLGTLCWRSGSALVGEHRHPDGAADDGADPRRVRYAWQPAAGDGQRRDPDGLELGAGHAGRSDGRLSWWRSTTGFSNPVLFAVLAQTIVVLLAMLGHAGIERVEPWLAVVMLLIIA